MEHRSTVVWLAFTSLITLTLGAQPLLANSLAGEPLPPEAGRLIDRAFQGEFTVGPRTTGQEVFEAVLSTELFVSGSVGPFDVYILIGDELDNGKKAQKLLDDVVETLTPAADLVTRLWPSEAGDGGLISGTRLPLVITDTEPGQDGYGDLISLLEYCERIGYSGWHPANAVDTAANRAAETTRTWSVQLFNLAHPVIADRPAAFIDHGIGYYTLAFVANRALRRGAWGMVPPWLANGLIDELDIAAYGKAYVGQESWVEQTPGWFRAGWSGFVPQGHRPPPPVTGPPAELAVTVNKTGNPWLDFDASKERHWNELVADRKSEAPASFLRAAETESFLPRDRAAARCLLHLMLTEGAREEAPLTSLLDREAQTPRDGMPDSDPLPVLFARALGGVPEVDRLESLDSLTLLSELERPDLIEVFDRNGALDALAMNDHREQSRWLSRQRYDSDARLALFNAFLEVEFAQQMAEWKAVAARLDGGLESALSVAKRYPRREKDLGPVLEAFWAGVAQDPISAEVAVESTSKQKSRKRSSRSRR